MIIRELYNCTPSEIWGAVNYLVPLKDRVRCAFELNDLSKWCKSVRRFRYFFYDEICGFKWYQSDHKNTLARIEYIPVTRKFNLVIYNE